jgi:enoyl-CoA hydratase/carnithine racemase
MEGEKAVREYKRIIVERDKKDKRILWIKLNYPERLNVLGKRMLDELYEALITADKDEEVQAIIITGNGRAFCAGADVNELTKMSVEEGVRWFQGYWRVLELIRTTGKPVIASVNGVCVAGGNELVMACDLAIACKSAKLGQPEVRVGSTAMGLGVQLLPLIVGEKRAREILFTAKLLTAEEAYNFGLINRVVNDEELEEESRKFAIEIIENSSPQAFRVIKAGLKFWTDLAMINLPMAREVTSMVWHSSEFRERAKEFLEKKKMNPRKFSGVTP